jgi:hypothetical protein
LKKKNKKKKKIVVNVIVIVFIFLELIVTLLFTLKIRHCNVFGKLKFDLQVIFGYKLINFSFYYFKR